MFDAHLICSKRRNVCVCMKMTLEYRMIGNWKWKFEYLNFVPSSIIQMVTTYCATIGRERKGGAMNVRGTRGVPAAMWNRCSMFVSFRLLLSLSGVLWICVCVFVHKSCCCYAAKFAPCPARCRSASFDDPARSRRSRPFRICSEGCCCILVAFWCLCLCCHFMYVLVVLKQQPDLTLNHDDDDDGAHREGYHHPNFFFCFCCCCWRMLATASSSSTKHWNVSNSSNSNNWVHATQKSMVL